MGVLVEIIPLPPDRWREYRSIRLEALRKDPQAFGSSYEKTLELPDKEWETRLLSTRVRMLFASDSGEIVGLMGIVLDVAEGKSSIVAAYVRESHRRRGIGKRLLEALFEIALNETEIPSIDLSVNGEEAPAVELYRAVGFVESRCGREMLGDGRPHQVITMRKELNRGGGPSRP